MTFKEKILKEFPNANIKYLVNECCPEHFGYGTEAMQTVEKYSSCFMDCNTCWDSEIVGDGNIENLRCDKLVVE